MISCLERIKNERAKRLRELRILRQRRGEYPSLMWAWYQYFQAKPIPRLTAENLLGGCLESFRILAELRQAGAPADQLDCAHFQAREFWTAWRRLKSRKKKKKIKYGIH